jgi:hypothetical protein
MNRRQSQTVLLRKGETISAVERTTAVLNAVGDLTGQLEGCLAIRRDEPVTRCEGEQDRDRADPAITAVGVTRVPLLESPCGTCSTHDSAVSAERNGDGNDGR